MMQKVAVATIDSRTTYVCLAVHGQSVPVDALFVTIAGAYEAPPFHWMCRTVVDITEEGMYDLHEMHLLADKEVAARVKRLGIDRVNKGYVAARKLKPPSIAVDALTPKVTEFTSLRVGRESLEDLADEDVLRAIDAIPERFVKEANGAGISESFWVTDRMTGQRYVLKRGQFHNESLNEVITSRIGRALGQDLPIVRFAEAPSGNGWVLVTHAEDMLPGYKVIGTAPGHAAIPKLPTSTWGGSADDPMRIVLNDFLMDGADRKGGNILRLLDESNVERWIPIDNSLSLMGWRNAAGKVDWPIAGDWSLAARLKIDSLGSYMRGTRGSPKGLFDLLVGSFDDAQKVRLYDEYVATLKAADLDSVFLALRRTASADVQMLAHLDEVEALIRKRADLLEIARERNLARLGVNVDELRKIDALQSFVEQVVVDADELFSNVAGAEAKFVALARWIDKAEIREKLAILARERGLTQNQVVNEIREAWSRFLRKQEVVVRVNAPTLEKVLKDGRFKSQFETGTSKGMFSPDRRASAEYSLFGLPTNLDPKLRPIYGYVDELDRILKKTEISDVDQYGEIRVIMKPTVRARTTVTTEDSLQISWEAENGNVLPSPLNDFSPASIRLPGARSQYDLYAQVDPDYYDRKLGELFSPETTLGAKGKQYFSYREIQIHGGVSTDDIAMIVFPEPTSAAQAERWRKIGRRLERMGIEWRIQTPLS